MKSLTSLLTLAILAAALTGCARFHTKQVDTFTNTSYASTSTNTPGETPGLQTRSTEVSAWTLFSAKSSLTSFEARQADASQSAKVGGLVQQGGTNTAATLQALANLLGALPK